MPKVVVIGSSNTDMILRVDRIPAPGETVLGESFATAAGGKGANQAVAAARAGGRVTFVGRVGDDDFGRQTIENLRRERIDVRHVSVDTTVPSGVALIFVDKKGENSIGVACGANARLGHDQIGDAREAIKSAGVVLTQLETSIEAVEATIEIARAHDVPLILNPAPAVKLSESIIRRVNVLIPNESEAAMLTGIAVSSAESAECAAKALHDMGAPTVLITLGERGIYCSDLASGFRELIQGFRVKAVDSTAAGDVFSGSFAVAYAKGVELPAAVTFANAAAAISVTRAGAQPSIAKLEEIEIFLTDHASDGAWRWFQRQGSPRPGSTRPGAAVSH